MIGALGVDPDKLFGARCLGASEQQVFVHVIIPAIVPNIVVGMKIAMGNSFMTVVSAEMVAAKTGVGFLNYELAAVPASLNGFSSELLRWDSWVSSATGFCVSWPERC